jgi:hypothetical protein
MRKARPVCAPRLADGFSAAIVCLNEGDLTQRPRINRARRRLTKTVPFGEAISRRSRKKESHRLAQRGRKKMQYLIPGLMIAIVVGGALVAMKIGR